MTRPPSASRPCALATLAAASLLSACGFGGGSSSPNPRGETARATFVNAQGQPAGTATLTSLGDRGVFISAQLRSLPEGTHAFHIHAVGKCEPPFESAGGHYNPAEHQHGFLDPNGEHNGDLPNITVRSDGTASAETVAWMVTLRGGDAPLLDDDGSALVIHSGVDDYRTDPTGNAGPRLACGVVER